MDKHVDIDTFDFGVTNGSITQDRDDNCFVAYLGGSGVGNFKTIEEARKILFGRLKNNLNYRIAQENKRLKALNDLLKKLDDDYFNIGMFKVVK